VGVVRHYEREKEGVFGKQIRLQLLFSQEGEVIQTRRYAKGGGEKGECKGAAKRGALEYAMKREGKTFRAGGPPCLGKRRDVQAWEGGGFRHGSRSQKVQTLRGEEIRGGEWAASDRQAT